MTKQLRIIFESYKRRQAVQYIKALEHWAQQFRNGNLSDEFADEIAYLLEDKAHDLKMDEPKTFNHEYDRDGWTT